MGLYGGQWDELFHLLVGARSLYREEKGIAIDATHAIYIYLTCN